MKKAEVDLNRETAGIKNQGAGNSPLLEASGNGASGMSSSGGIKTQSEERGRIEKVAGRKRIPPVLDRWPHEAKIPTGELGKGEQEDSTETEPEGKENQSR